MNSNKSTIIHHLITVLALCLLPLAAMQVASLYNQKPDRGLGTVASVIDGDTLKLVDGRTVRLAWIDAPELDQPGGAEAKSELEKMVLARRVVLVEYGVDGQQQVVAGVLADGITDVNFLMLRSGNAWYDHRDVHRHRQRHSADASNYPWAHDEARRQGFGLWDGKPTPPWEWRRRHSYHVQSCGEYPDPVVLPIKAIAV